MRSSDWISDVCSSDLHAGGAGLTLLRAARRSVETLEDRAGRLSQPVEAQGLSRRDRRNVRANEHALGAVEGDRRQPQEGGAHRGADPYRRNAPTCPSMLRSEEHTSELQSLMRISYAVFCLKHKT